MKIKIEKMGINGEGIGYTDRLPTFVESAYPGEIVEAEIVKRFERYVIAKRTELIQHSPHRIVAPCPIQDQCGGCSIMTLSLDQQLKEKEKLLYESLRKYMTGKVPRIRPIVANPTPLGYRNQCKFPISLNQGELTSGMYKPNSNYFVSIDHCIVHDESIERVRKEVMRLSNEYRLPSFNPPKYQGLRYIVLRSFEGSVQVTLVTGQLKLPAKFVEDISKIEGVKTVAQSINDVKHSREIIKNKTDILWGSKTITCTMNGIDLVVSPQSFFQLNIKQANAIYNKVVASIEPCDCIVEAYCGIGAMSLMIKHKAKEVIGIDSIQAAIDNANINAQINQADNVKFVAGDAAISLQKIAASKKIDVLVVDPPRSGLSEQMLEIIKESNIAQLIYVSCNPSTLAKNLEAIQSVYEILEITPFDMFSHTPLIETVVNLRRKSPE
jgi:23S rRNA (uracil-5-)-methyltransferase RumA